MSKTFKYHVPTQAQIETMDELRKQFSRLESAIQDATVKCREQSIALTKLEESAMWLNKAITHSESD